MWVGVARVKNEADIIEAFVRHSLCHFDQLIVVDHASTDSTRAILGALVDEGLPLEVENSNVFEPQGVALTRLMRRAFNDVKVSWLMPLDADEFIEVADGSMLRDRKGVYEAETLEVFWNNFQYQPKLDNELDIAKRMLLRSSVQSELPKVVIPRSIGLDPNVVIYEGSHFVARNQKIVRGRRADDLVLCHFPIRSLEQYRLKVIIGTLRYMINPSKDEYLWGWHYQKAYELIINDRLDLLEELMRDESISYSGSKTAATAIKQPFTRLGGALRYTSGKRSPSEISVLARYAESIVINLKKESKSSSVIEGIRRFITSAS